jgi:antitoxin component of MazEF toxin-antitoxin module
MFSRTLKLHHHGGSIMITIPADVVREFQLSKGRRLEMSYDYEDRKLVIDLDSADPSKSPQPQYAEATQ